jgi:alpha-D-xyloside xylohydrolase
MRGLVMDYPEDPVARNISDQYMYGPSLMVCPVYEYGATSRDVYLPDGKLWYDYYSEFIYAGGQTIEAEAPYERIPLFVPSGAILVSGKDVNHVDEQPADELTVDCYTGSDGAFVLYEDDGTTNAYENGEYSIIPFYIRESEMGCDFIIGQRTGEFKGMLHDRKFNVRLHLPDRIIEFPVRYNGSTVVYNQLLHLPQNH